MSRRVLIGLSATIIFHLIVFYALITFSIAKQNLLLEQLMTFEYKEEQFDKNLQDLSQFVNEKMTEKTSNSDDPPVPHQNILPKPVNPISLVDSLSLKIRDKMADNTDFDSDDITNMAEGIDLYHDISLDDVQNNINSSEGGKYSLLEQMPSFQGGDISNFRIWINQNIKYDKSARERNISGTIIISFIVNTYGEVENVTLIKGIDPMLDNEALKVIKSCPQWNPGKQHGKPVKVSYKLPLVFSM